MICLLRFAVSVLVTRLRQTFLLDLASDGRKASKQWSRIDVRFFDNLSGKDSIFLSIRSGFIAEELHDGANLILKPRHRASQCLDLQIQFARKANRSYC